MKYFRNTALAVALGIALAACVIARTVNPMGVLPKLDIPAMVLLSLVALLADHYLAKGEKQFCPCLAAPAALTFGLLPWAAGFATGMEALKLAAIGGITFGVSAWLFTQMQQRLSTGPAAKLAPILSAVGLWLAAQCFAGIAL